MRASARGSLLAASLLAASLLASASPALAQRGVYLPQAPTGAGGEDSIETAEGVRCRQSINSNGPYLDMGFTGSTSRAAPRDPASGAAALVTTERYGDEALAYARVTVPLGRRPQRLDCSRLYEMEISRLRRELELARMAAE